MLSHGDDTMATVRLAFRPADVASAQEYSLQERSRIGLLPVLQKSCLTALGIGIGGTSVGRWMFNKGSCDLPPIDRLPERRDAPAAVPAALLFMWILLRGNAHSGARCGELKETA